MIQTPQNKHLFVRLNHCLPPKYFNPPKDCHEIVCFKPNNSRKSIQYSDQYIFINKMGGWVLDRIIFAKTD